MIAHPIGDPKGYPTTHPNRGRIARPGPSRPGPYPNYILRLTPSFWSRDSKSKLTTTYARVVVGLAL